MQTRSVLALSLSLFAFACGAADGAPSKIPEPAPESGEPEPEAAETTFTVAPPEWRTCSLVDGANDKRAECATVQVLRDHDAGVKGGTLGIALKRIPASRVRRGTVWILDGGPGMSATHDLSGLVGDMPARVPDLDFIGIDHRGVGQSAMLECVDERTQTSLGGADVTDAEWSRCIERLARTNDLTMFTATAAARDLGAIIDVVKEPGDRTLVWGGSYGSFLALRYLQIFPDQPDGVVLEGIAPPSLGFESFDAEMNEVGQKIFEACAEDDDCRAHLGADPWSTARDVVTSLDEGHCPELRSRSVHLKGFLAGLLYNEYLRGAAPAVIHRVKRCTEADVAALSHFGGLFRADGASPIQGAARPRVLGVTGDGFSEVLSLHVKLTEFWGDGAPTIAAAEKEYAGLVIAGGATLELAERAEHWPRTAPDQYHGKLPTYTKPLLMLQGGLDPATPPRHANEMAKRFRGPNQTYALFPVAAHDPSYGTVLPNGESCARQIHAAFLAEPTRELDTSCIAELDTKPRFLTEPRITKYFFGTESPWD